MQWSTDYEKLHNRPKTYANQAAIDKAAYARPNDVIEQVPADKDTKPLYENSRNCPTSSRGKDKTEPIYINEGNVYANVSHS